MPEQLDENLPESVPDFPFAVHTIAVEEDLTLPLFEGRPSGHGLTSTDGKPSGHDEVDFDVDLGGRPSGHGPVGTSGRPSGHGPVGTGVGPVGTEAATGSPGEPSGRPSGHLVFVPDGKPSGHHAVIAWSWASATDLPPMPPWQPTGHPPVVALLDSGVRQHPSLPAEPLDGTPFCVVADWHPPVPVSPPAVVDAQETLGPFWGHGTFIAGLIRRWAPGAQVLSMPLMSDAGSVSEENVLSALRWLKERLDQGAIRLDVVLMPFGRPKVAGGDGHEFTEVIGGLGAHGVEIVASAGNAGSTDPTVPACLADEPGSPVVSVGAAAPDGTPALFSNRGPWVKQWLPGSDVVSLMPETLEEADPGNGYARWSGTSLAAARYAGERAQARIS